MTGDDKVFLGGALVSAVILVAVFWLAAWPTINLAWEQDAIKHGAGRYNPTTGVFEWLNEESNQ